MVQSAYLQQRPVARKDRLCMLEIEVSALDGLQEPTSSDILKGVERLAGRQFVSSYTHPVTQDA